MNVESLAAENARCLRSVANALIADQGLILFLKELAPQWGSSTGKTRPYAGLNKRDDPVLRCIVRIDSRTAILLNDALYSQEGPSRMASHLAAALRNPQIDESGKRCTIQVAGMQPILISIDQYSDADGNAVEPDSPALDHRVVSILPA